MFPARRQSSGPSAGSPGLAGDTGRREMVATSLTGDPSAEAQLLGWLPCHLGSPSSFPLR